MKILIVEDERELAGEIVRSLSGQGFVCELASSLAAADEKIHLYEYDVVVLDLMLPDGDGLSLLRSIKERNAETGIIIVSAKDALPDRIEGLERGADDYLTKPFHLGELNARIQALLRRNIRHGDEVLRCGDIQLRPRAMEVSINGEAVDLTPKEFELLLYFIVNRNRVLGKQAIAEHLWGDAYDMAENFDVVYVHVNNLRKKLTAAGAGDMIRTIYGVGYKLEAP
ncbi:MAG: response regulator transcription factor [Bacteroidetes bacterium]|nr:response regulator transcription factor [Bacteroidota bacterium]